MGREQAKKFEDRLRELATDWGSPVEVSVFEKVMGIAKGTQRASPENQRQTWSRFRKWCLGIGLEIHKVIERDEPVLIVYEPSEAIRLAAMHKARRLHRRMSQAPGIHAHMHQQTNTPDSTDSMRDLADAILDSEGLAKELGCSVFTARELLRSGDLKAFPIGKDEGSKRTRRSWVLEWTERRAAMWAEKRAKKAKK